MKSIIAIVSALLAFLVMSGWILSRKQRAGVTAVVTPRAAVVLPKPFVAPRASAPSAHLNTPPTPNLSEHDLAAAFGSSTLLIPQELTNDGCVTASELAILKRIAWRYREELNDIVARRLRVQVDDNDPVVVYRLDRAESEDLRARFYAEVASSVGLDFLQRLQDSGATKTLDVAFDGWGYWATGIRHDSQNSTKDQVSLSFVFDENLPASRTSKMSRSLFLSNYGPIARALLPR